MRFFTSVSLILLLVTTGCNSVQREKHLERVDSLLTLVSAQKGVLHSDLDSLFTWSKKMENEKHELQMKLDSSQWKITSQQFALYFNTIEEIKQYQAKKSGLDSLFEQQYKRIFLLKTSIENQTEQDAAGSTMDDKYYQAAIETEGKQLEMLQQHVSQQQTGMAILTERVRLLHPVIEDKIQSIQP